MFSFLFSIIKLDLLQKQVKNFQGAVKCMEGFRDGLHVLEA
jgi:hypothetical protein